MKSASLCCSCCRSACLLCCAMLSCAVLYRGVLCCAALFFALLCCTYMSCTMPCCVVSSCVQLQVQSEVPPRSRHISVVACNSRLLLVCMLPKGAPTTLSWLPMSRSQTLLLLSHARCGISSMTHCIRMGQGGCLVVPWRPNHCRVELQMCPRALGFQARQKQTWLRPYLPSRGRNMYGCLAQPCRSLNNRPLIAPHSSSFLRPLRPLQGIPHKLLRALGTLSSFRGARNTLMGILQPSVKDLNRLLWNSQKSRQTRPWLASRQWWNATCRCPTSCYAVFETALHRYLQVPHHLLCCFCNCPAWLLADAPPAAMLSLQLPCIATCRCPTTCYAAFARALHLWCMCTLHAQLLSCTASCAHVHSLLGLCYCSCLDAPASMLLGSLQYTWVTPLHAPLMVPPGCAHSTHFHSIWCQGLSLHAIATVSSAGPQSAQTWEVHSHLADSQFIMIIIIIIAVDGFVMIAH